MKQPQVSIDIGYNPVDDDSDTGFRRPPRIAACLVEYLWVIGVMGAEDDGGAFSEDELQSLIDSPLTFFTPLTEEQKTTLILKSKEGLEVGTEYFVHPATLTD